MSSIAALQSAIDGASAGDVLILADGTYLDGAFDINTSGIAVRAATPGGVYLNNVQSIDISGNNNTFSGFQFTARTATDGVVITVGGDHNILAQLNFDGYSAQKYINLRGRYNAVSYSNFKNKPTTAQIGNLIHIAPDPSLPGYNKIRYCSFQDMPGAGGDNGNECVRISNGATSNYISRTVVEFCYFNNTGPGDSEAISVKCRENVLRYNTFTNNQSGMMVFRNGDDNIAYGNFFMSAGGIRVKEANNIYCYNNYFEDADNPMVYFYISPNLNNINFIHNTFVECGAIDLDSGATGNTWANNIFKKSSGSIFTGSTAGIAWAGNICFGSLGVSIPSGMTSANPQLALNSDGYFGLSSGSPAIDAASADSPAILDIANVDDDPILLRDISGQARPLPVILKDVGCDEFGTNSTFNRPLALSDVGPSYLGGPAGVVNLPPSVSLTAPTNGTSFTAPASIAMTAEASDSDGTITTVGFYNGSTLLGSDTTAPYAYVWTNVPVGEYNLTACTMDNSGAVSTSTVAAITVTAATYTNTYTTPGTTNWICPDDVASVRVECWGGGGAGGGAQRYPQTSGGARAGGGAGGAYARVNSYAVIPGNTYYISVGAGGVSEMTDTVRVPGGDSWFNTVNAPSPFILTKGGAGGETVMLQNTTSRYGEGGAGSAVGSIGEIVHAGGSGGTPTGSAVGGSGGGSGGSDSAGNPGDPTSGIGATAVTDGGPGGDSNVSGNSGPGQEPVSPPGGGGGGARCANSTPGYTGGPGAAGQVVLIYTISAAPTAGFNATPTTGGAPLAVAFTDTSTGTVTDRFWRFGDGSSTNTAETNLLHTYWFPGTNTVSLIVDGVGGSSTTSQSIVVTSVDTVGDGVSDWWRALYFGEGSTTNADSGATNDFDYDGLDNLGEYLADTNPTNAASRLAVISLALDSKAVQLIWIGGSNAWQSVQRSGNLADTNGWGSIYTNTPPTSVTNTLLDTGSATNRFYRIKAWR